MFCIESGEKSEISKIVLVNRRQSTSIDIQAMSIDVD